MIIYAYLLANKLSVAYEGKCFGRLIKHYLNEKRDKEGKYIPTR